MFFVKKISLSTNVERFLKEAQYEAQRATCKRRPCGAVIVKGNSIIGKGFNSPPGNDEGQRQCNSDKKLLDSKVTDKTCCVHAEERAIIDALRQGHDLSGSTMYFTSVDKEGKRLCSGEPFCTLCSKLALDVGVSTWILEHEKGIISYSSQEYNKLSYAYSGHH